MRHIILAASVMSVVNSAGAGVITFEEYENGTLIGTQYFDQGVALFSSGPINPHILEDRWPDPLFNRGLIGYFDSVFHGSSITIDASLEYQTCDDVLCYPPDSMPISFELDIVALDKVRAPENVRHQSPPRPRLARQRARASRGVGPGAVASR